MLDEPSIGLHPKDNVKMINTIQRLRDVGNTVVVVEHNEETIRAADHIIEMGPGPGVHGGHVVTSGSLKEVLDCRESPTAQYLGGTRTIDVPSQRRIKNKKVLHIKGARANNLNNIDVGDSNRSLYLYHRGIRIGKKHAYSRSALQETL